VIVPALKLLPAGGATVHVTPVVKAPVPVTVAVNCCDVPMITGVVGVTVIPVIAGPV
jgi:hypothetical protein